MQQVVDFGDELHVAVLDAVVHHFDVVSRAACAHPGDAWLSILLRTRGDGVEHGAESFPGGIHAARHQARPPQRPSLAARNAHADKLNLVCSQRRDAAHGVGEVGVAAVNDDVARFQVRLERFDGFVHRRAGRHHQQNRPRRF